MNKLIISAGILLALLIGAEQVLDANRETHRIITQTVRSIPGNEGIKADTIRSFTIQLADTAWSYEQKESNWYYPAYKDAFGLNDQIKRFIESVVESQGTVIASDRTSEQHYGFSTPSMLTITLADSLGKHIQSIQIGRSGPGRDANESYMAPVNNDTLFHVHADPRRLITWQREHYLPPLIDPKMLPSALARRAITILKFTSGPVREIERIEIAPEEGENAHPQGGPTYEWHARIDGKKKQVVNSSVYTYISFLKRIKYSKLHPPSGTYGFSQSAIIMTDDSETSDTLEVGDQTPEDNVYIRHRTTGHILSITRAKADLLFPTPTQLDTLPRPSAYDQAEPTGPFSLASP